MRKPLIITGIILSVLLLIQCGKEPPSNSIPSSIAWNKEQSVIIPAMGTQNTWSGFDVKKDAFAAAKNISKFIVWRNEKETKNLTLQYILKGFPVKVFINSKEVFKLKPSFEWGTFTAGIDLHKGFNLIEFRLSGKKNTFKIKAVTIGNEILEQRPHLETGQSFSRFHPAGSGKIKLGGDGEVKIRVVSFVNGEKKTREELLKPGFLSSSVDYTFEIPTLGFIQVIAQSGQWDVVEYSFTPQAQPKADNTSQYAGIMKEKPGIHIFLIDGCHADHLGVYGYHRDTSPNIDKFAEDCVIFDNAYANATFTRSSVASIFTGFHPHRHKLRILTNRLPKGLFMLPEFMKKQGYKTALLTEAGNISRFFGFSQGVDLYKKIFRRWDDPRYLKNNMNIFFAQWIEDYGPQGPLFTYIHFREPHFPIIPPPPYLDMYKPKEKRTGKPKGDRLIFNLKKMGEDGYKFSPEEVTDVIDDYDSTINHVDMQVGKLIDKLKQAGRYDSSFVIFTSDHGEALYEHKYWGHGQNVYNEASRVPFLIKFPKGFNLKGRVQRVVQLVDLFPTIAALFGDQRYFDGSNLLDSIKIEKLDDAFGYSTTFGMPPSIGMRFRHWYYIYHRYNNSEELFDLDKNPLTNIAGAKKSADMVLFFRSKFIDWYIQFDNIERTSQSVDLKKLPKEELENLKSLGYID